MAAGAWALERRMKPPFMLAFGVLPVFFTAQFASWHVVGSQLL